MLLCLRSHRRCGMMRPGPAAASLCPDMPAHPHARTHLPSRRRRKKKKTFMGSLLVPHPLWKALPPAAAAAVADIQPLLEPVLVPRVSGLGGGCWFESKVDGCRLGWFVCANPTGSGSEARCSLTSSQPCLAKVHDHNATTLLFVPSCYH